MPYYFYGFDGRILCWCAVYYSLPGGQRLRKQPFKRYSQQISSRRITGAEAAQRVLSMNGVTGVRIERISGNLTDHYDPRQCYPAFGQCLRQSLHRSHRRCLP